MEKLLRLLAKTFSIFILISLLGGSLIFLLFVLALVIGGEQGGNLATLTSATIMPYFIRLAALAMAIGLFVIYVNGDHQLSMEE